jgi:hypothetical protein
VGKATGSEKFLKSGMSMMRKWKLDNVPFGINLPILFKFSVIVVDSLISSFLLLYVSSYDMLVSSQ